MKDRLMDEILTAALRTFSNVGYGNASVQEICTAAGISPATFYRHYTGKDDIFRVVMQRFNDEETRVLEPIERMDLEEGLLHIAKAHLESMHNSSATEAVRLIYAEAPRFPDIARGLLEGTTQWLTMLMAFLRKHDPTLSRKRSYDLAVLFMDMVGSRYEHESLLGAPGFDRRRRTQHARLAVDVFLGGFRGS